MLSHLLKPLFAAALVAATPAFAQVVDPIAVKRASDIRDADTRRWWLFTGALASDAMEGRDTGSAGYDRAATLVEARLRRAGLKPAGEAGSFRQTVPMHEVRVVADGTAFAIQRDNGDVQSLSFLHDITVTASEQLPDSLSAPMVFRGYCSAADLGADVKGKVVVCFGNRRRGLPNGADRIAAATAAGSAGLLVVDDIGFDIEPPRWPDAYARTITLRDGAHSASAAPVTMRLAASAFAALIKDTGADPTAILKAGSAKTPLPSFDIPARLVARFRTTRRDFASDNILALLPGTDTRLKPEVVVVSAHLDGYGFGEPVDGDRLYNGAFDDAAYVSTLVRLVERRRGHGFRRSLLVAVFTGEEKGLLGARWFTTHPTVPQADLAADINLDQLRPLFPLKILTVHALDQSTLGETVKSVAAARHIEVRPDLEPERNLNQRADHYPFLKIGVPATAFVFGYDPGTDAEARYREWYRVRYHRPQDDMTQPIDFVAARDFNQFFYKLTETIADVEVRPAMLMGQP